MRKLVCLVVSAFIFPVFAGSVYYASPTGTSSGAGTAEDPYDIVTACSKLGDNTRDEVKLLPGTYAMGAAQLANIDYYAKLTGTGATAADVILDGEGAGKTVKVQYGAQARNITFANYGVTAVTVDGSSDYKETVLSNCVVRGVTGKSYVCTTSNAGVIRLVDCVFHDNEAADTYGSVYASGNPKLTILRCKFYDNEFKGWGGTGGGALFMMGAGTVDSCVISNNVSSGYGGGISAYGSGAFVTNTLFYGNTARGYNGGGLYSKPSAGTTNTFVTCVFRANHNSVKSVNGAGACLGGSGLSLFRRCTFEDNLVEGQSAGGGGIYGSSSTGSALIDGCTFARNRAVCSDGMGGACQFEMYGDGIVIRDCVFTNNITSGVGGAIGVRGPSSLGQYMYIAVTDTLFVDNVATNYGGAFGQDYDNNARIGYVGFYTNCVFRGNVSRRGAAFSGHGATFSGCLFDSNRTEKLGGSVQGGAGIYVYSRGNDRACNPEATNRLAVVGCVFTNNVTAGGEGVAICGEQDTFYSITDSTFVGNYKSNTSDLKYPGGAISIPNTASYATVDRCRFIRNQSRSYGGAIGFKGSTKLKSGIVRNSLFVCNTNTSDYAGAIYLTQNCTVESCSFIGNVSAGQAGAIDNGGGTGTSLYNCLFYGNRLTWSAVENTCDVAGTNLRNNDSFSCCSEKGWTFPDAHGNIVVTEPKFADAAAGDYRLKKGSPCINVGLNRDWMIGARDLQNNPKTPRIVDGTVDIGCYEYRANIGFAIFFK